MRVSMRLAQSLSNVDLLSVDPPTMLDRIGQRLGAVEDVINFSERYIGITIVKVVSCNKHPDADKLNVCLIDDGQKIENIERNDQGLVQVVCGAPNVREGITVAWIPPGATVPSTFDKDPFVLEARELRGVVSNGMLASAAELGISDDHSGILEIDQQVNPGESFAKVFDLDDIVIDCENKMFTHRPDCFGVLGVARELAGINALKFESPDWYKQPTSIVSSGGSLGFSSKNEIPEKVPRFMAQVVENVQVNPSDLAIQSALVREGSRPINNIVDFTNYFMLLTAQPTHAFDYDKVKSLCGEQVTIFPRLANEGETLELLNGKTVKLTANDIVIATDKQAIALGGIMGGAATEVDENTKNIIIECANFDMYTIRRTSMRLGIFSDAVTRFNKGQSYLQNPVILNKIVNEVCQNTGGTAGIVFDSNPEEDLFSQLPVNLTPEFVNLRLGTELNQEDIKTILEMVEFKVVTEAENIEVIPPFWRTDIKIPEDLVEEVGRLYGYDKLPVGLPKRSSAPVGKNPELELISKLRQILSSLGANEVLSYSFISEQLINSAGQSTKEAYQLSNAISPELQYYRLTLTPSLLSKVNQNIRLGHDRFAIFELGKTHLKLRGVDEEGLPQENSMLSLVYAANDKAVSKNEGAAYYQAKNYLDYLANKLGLKLDYEPLTQDVKFEIARPFQPGRSALVTDRNSGSYIGVIGEYNASVRSKLKLPVNTAGFEVLIQPLLEQKIAKSYSALAKFPKISQDITFVCPSELRFGDLETSLNQSLNAVSSEDSIVVSSASLSIFKKSDSDEKNISFRLTLHHPDRTLITDEANKFVDSVVSQVESELKVKRI